LSDVENDKRAIGSEALVRLADALGASLDYLLKGVEQESDARTPLVIPPELLEAAEEQEWSLGEAQDLLRANRIVVARRTTQRVPARDRLTKQEWLDLYDTLFEREHLARRRSHT